MFTDTYILKQWLLESHNHFKATKEYGKKVRRYYNGDQLDNTIKTILANRGQPEQYENNIAKHHNSIMGYKKDRQIDIKLFATQAKKRASAELLNATVKSIINASDYDVEIDRLDDELGVEGISIVEFTIKATGQFDSFGRENYDIDPNYVPSSEIYLDPFSKANNYNDDARYIHRPFWIDKEDIYKLGFPKELVDGLNNTNYLSSMSDDDLYADTNIRERVLLTYSWYRKWDKEKNKDVYYYCFWCDETILLQGENPYKHNQFPYEIEFYHRDFSGEIKYWGLYRDVMPLQDNINYAKLRLQNMLANNKTYVNRTAVIDENIEQFNAENSFDNATVMVEDINGIKDVRQNVQIQQILNTIIDNRNQISELLNSNKEMLGMANNRMSQVGQERRIQSGLVGLNRFMGKADNLQKRCIKKMISLICQYFDANRVISIIDEDYAQDYLEVNTPVQDENGNVKMEYLPDGSVKPIATNILEFDKYSVTYIAKMKSSTMSDERLRLNAELMRTLKETDPELVSFLLPDVLKDMESPNAKKVKDFLEARANANQNNPNNEREKALQDEITRLELLYKQSQTTLNNAKAKAMDDKNKIDLQKAYSNSVVASENVKTKQQRNMLEATRYIRGD